MASNFPEDPLHAYLYHHGISLDCLSDPIKFRAICARRRFPRGSTIITSQSLAALPLPQKKTQLCNRCFKQVRLQRCTKCKAVYFCGKECFAQAWKEWHKYTCDSESAKQSGNKSKVKDASPIGNNDNVDSDDELTADGVLDEEMLTRVAITTTVHHANLLSGLELKYPTDSSIETPSVTLGAFWTLMSHAKSHSPSVIASHESIAQRVILNPRLRAIPGYNLSMPVLTTFLCQFRCNNFAVHDAQLFLVGEGCYPVGSLFNHSCRPNAIVAYEGATQVIRCIEDIEIGKEVVIGYVDLAEGRKARKQKLKDKYFFTCTCERCREGAGELAFVDALLGEQQPAWERAQDLLGIAPSPTRLWIEAEIARWDLDGSDSVLTPHEILGPGTPLSISTFTNLVLKTLVPFAYRTPAGESTPISPYNQALITLIAQLHAHPRSPSPAQVPTTLRSLVTASRLFYGSISADAWGDAAKLGLYVMAVYLLVYPRYHPIIGQHALALAKCLWNGVARVNASAAETQIRRCEKWVGVAREVIGIGCGAGPVAREVEALAEVIRENEKSVKESL